MSLDFNVSKVKDYQNLSDDLIRVTSFAMLVTGMTTIKDDADAKELVERVTILNMTDEKMFDLSPSLARRMIGLHVNVPQKSRARFMNGVKSSLEASAKEAVRGIWNDIS